MSVQLIRGTTPRITCRIPGDLTETHLFFSVGPENRHTWFTVGHERMTVDYDSAENETAIVFTLTQKETCACKAGKAYAQFRAVDVSGNGMASNKIEVEIVDVIKDGVISYA